MFCDYIGGAGGIDWVGTGKGVSDTGITVRLVRGISVTGIADSLYGASKSRLTRRSAIHSVADSALTLVSMAVFLCL